MLAAELGVAFVPIRKKGKLPGQCISFDYTLEYGTDTFEMQASSIRPGMKVIIVDDLLATGGTMGAACQLVEKAGGIVQQIIVLIELVALNGRSKVQNGNIHSFIKYD